MKIAVIGCGMLGYDIVRTFSRVPSTEIFCFDILPNENFLGYKVEKLDITDFETTYRTLTKLNPDVVIHTVSLTDVDKCETSPIDAYRVNSIGTKNIAISCNRFDSLMVYISTDYVFDGNKGAPYTEFDSPNPINVYGKTKLLGETFVQEIAPRYLIIRSSWLFGKNKKNYLETWYNKIISKEFPISVVKQYGSPTYTKDLAEYIKILIEKNRLGLYHITNSGYAERVDIVKEIFNFVGEEFSEKKISLVEPETVFKNARRPKDSRLNNFVLELENLPKLPSWQDALKNYLKELQGRR